MKNHFVRSILVFSSIIIAAIVFCFLLQVKQDKEVNEQYIDNWAVYNYGQDINGVKGISGIDINVIPVSENNIGNSNVIVAVVDSGVDEQCEALNGRLLHGWDFYNNDETVYDEYLYDYHGTYISTTIAKVAPNIKILPVKFMESTRGSIEDAISSIQYAIDNGAQIINCSWNFNDYNEELYNIISSNPNILFVCSAGNYNGNLDEVSIYPCCFSLDNIINVMAINNIGKAYISSGYGKGSVDVAAPGEYIKVILPEDDEVYINGTSVATAFVSAAAALILSENDTLTPKEIKDIINSSTHKTDELKALCISGGYLDISSSLQKCISIA